MSVPDDDAPETETSVEANGATTDETGGATTDESDGVTADESDGVTADEIDGATTDESDGATTDENGGATTVETGGATTDERKASGGSSDTVTGDTATELGTASSDTTGQEEPETTGASQEFENLGAFLLTTIGVTAMFTAIFVFTFPPPIDQYFSAIVISVSVVTLIIGMVLDLLGYFEDDPSVLTETTERRSEPQQLESVRAKPNKPLPKKINFDDEIRRLRDHFDGELPRQMDSFLTEYQELKSSSKNRKVIAGSLRAALNPISALVDSEEMEEMVDEMGDRLFAYIKADPVDNMVVTEYAFFKNGVQIQPVDQQGEQVRIKATVHNEGDTAKAEVAARFKNEAGVPVKTAYLPVGEVVTEARKELNTNVYVPSLATSVDVFVVRATQDTPVLDM